MRWEVVPQRGQSPPGVIALAVMVSIASLDAMSVISKPGKDRAEVGNNNVKLQTESEPV